MKVLIWVNQFPTFSETFIRDQVIALNDDGIDVTVFCNYTFDNELESFPKCYNFNLSQNRKSVSNIIPTKKSTRFFKACIILLTSIFTARFLPLFKSFNFLKYGKQALSLELFFKAYYLISEKFDIVHAHFGDNGVRAAKIKELGVPFKLITTFHGYDIRAGIDKGGTIYKKLFSLADSIIAIADYNREKLILFGAPAHKIIDLANGINTVFFHAKNRDYVQNPIQLVSVARLSPEKGILIAINALKLLLKDMPELKIHYTIIGEGPLRPAYEEYIKDNKLEEFVSLVGRKTSLEVRDTLEISHLYLLPSVEEILPTVLLEAQASGLPIVATNVGAVSSMAPYATIVSSHSSHKFKDGIKSLIAERDNWLDLAEKQRTFVINNYNIDIVIEKLISIYKS